jgi:peptide deformylase|tara:strand:- start:226 stop:771 length:546 start_codon:yes stop_codon:yes gene_type:complete
MKELKLIPPTDPRVNNAIAPFVDDMLKDEDIKDRQELSDAMFESMSKYGGIGLSANQVGLPFNMFVIGGHPSIEKGLKMTCFNPMIVSASEETVRMKEGCLTFPFIFLDIERPRKVVVKYTDNKGDLQEAHLDGMMSRIFQHEYDHMLGRNFTEKVSKFKLKRAMEKRDKMLKKIDKSNKA